jgi:hypothetical protein
MITDIVFITEDLGDITYRHDRLPYHPRVGETVDLGVSVPDIYRVSRVHWQVARGRLLVHCEPV